MTDPAAEDRSESTARADTAGIVETLKVPGVVFTLIAFFAYCSGEATCFLWTSSFFAGTRRGLSDSLIASFGMLIFLGLMIGRVISGMVTDRLGDRKMIRYGIILELAGIAVIFLPSIPYQMTAAYIGSCFMPMVFGQIQEHIGIGVMPVYLLIFALMNYVFLEFTYISIKNTKGSE